MTFSPWMSRCQSVAIEWNSSALTGLFGDLAQTARRVSEERRRQRWCGGGGMFGAKVGEAGEVGGGGGGGGGGGLERTPQTTKLACSSSWVWSWSRLFNKTVTVLSHFLEPST